MRENEEGKGKEQKHKMEIQERMEREKRREQKVSNERKEQEESLDENLRFWTHYMPVHGRKRTMHGKKFT